MGEVFVVVKEDILVLQNASRHKPNGRCHAVKVSAVGSR
jgi:hypothetical protein